MPGKITRRLLVGATLIPLAATALTACGPAPAASPPAIFTENPCAHLPAGWSCSTAPPDHTAAGGNDIAGITAAQSRNISLDEAYIRAHPVPPVSGMTAGIITSVTDLGDLCNMKTQTAAYLQPARGDDTCDAWTFSVVTSTGATIRLKCGGPGRQCEPGHVVMPGDEGEYLYVPSRGGQITSDADTRFMGCYTSESAGYPCPFGAKVFPP